MFFTTSNFTTVNRAALFAARHTSIDFIDESMACQVFAGNRVYVV